MKNKAKYRNFSLNACCSLLCILCYLTAPAQAANIGGVQLKETIKLGKENLLLNGAGQRTKFFIDLYIAALYLSEKTDDAQFIIDAEEVMIIQIHVISNLITSDKLIQGTTEGFIKSTRNNTAPIQGQIHDFLDAFKEPITIGDIFEIVYQPGKGVAVVKNRHVVKKLSENLSFKRALFGIWLSDDPAQASLKNRLLGK